MTSTGRRRSAGRTDSEVAIAVEMTELNLDNFVDDKGVRYIGQATRRPNGQWVCLADVNGCLCLVEVKIRLLAKVIPNE